ncbi:MAG TPA: hypothetical protein VE441_13270 [Mycobacterium sp.]|jgi:anti-anti-sigma regulatory factor|nr:hypothetical protein [Mycobacterium sp.]
MQTTSAGPAVPDEGVTRTRHNGAGAPVQNAADALISGITVRRLGPRSWLLVIGELTALTRRHLDDLLTSLIDDGIRQVTVALATATEVDDCSLSVLRIAQAELGKRGGQLLVTAARAAARARLGDLNGPLASNTDG